MNTRHMEFFVRTAELGSMSAAAQELYISPQGLSQALQQMEKELGEKLFFRDKNKLHLTAVGEVAYEAYKQIIAINDDMTDHVGDVKRNHRKRVRKIKVMAAPIIASTCLARVLTLFRQRNPDALVQVIEVSPEEFFDMADFDVDCVGVVGLVSTMSTEFIRTAPEHVDIKMHYSCPQEICMSSRSPAATKSVMTVRDMEKGRMVLFGGDIRMLNHLPEGFDFNAVAVQSRNISLCRSLVAAEKNTYGITNRFVEYYLKTSGLISIPFAPEIEVSYGYIVNRDSTNPLVKDFLDVLKGEIEQVRKAYL